MQLSGNGIGTEGVRTEFDDHVLTVYLTGEIDHHNAGRMRMAIDEEICRRRPKRVILDLGSIDFMDSSGLGLVMGRYALIRKMNGDLILRNPSQRVKKIFDLSGLDRMIHMEYDKGGKAN